jgi:methylenetetrahydrofolate dehydrogenase (NADP+) / methenyltetrahydrofolate cyclohydrolase
MWIIMSQIINGKDVAKKVKEEIVKEIIELKTKQGKTPCLAVVLVGDDPASKIYVGMKEKVAGELGIKSLIIRLPENIKKDEIIQQVQKLNENNEVDGILVQLPLPKHISESEVVCNISSHKDVDGLTQINMGKLIRGENPDHVACTPAGVIELIKSTGIEIKGKNAVVVGRSNIVGKPLAILLLNEHATVTICHSRTKDLGEITKNADILIAAVGKAKIINGKMIKKGAIVIDVGTNRTEAGLLGDVDFESAKEIAGFITPVPGGVGPMTIAMLMKNTINAAKINL